MKDDSSQIFNSCLVIFKYIFCILTVKYNLSIYIVFRRPSRVHTKIHIYFFNGPKMNISRLKTFRAFRDSTFKVYNKFDEGSKNMK